MVDILSLIDTGRIHSIKEWDLFNESQPHQKGNTAWRNFALKRSFVDDVVTTVGMEEIPPELIFNMDQTGIKLVPSTSWSMEQKGVKRVEGAGQNDKRQVTAVLCGTIQGDLLPLQIFYKGKTECCHLKYPFP